MALAEVLLKVGPLNFILYTLIQTHKKSSKLAIPFPMIRTETQRLRLMEQSQCFLFVMMVWK